MKYILTKKTYSHEGIHKEYKLVDIGHNSSPKFVDDINEVSEEIYQHLSKTDSRNKLAIKSEVAIKIREFTYSDDSSLTSKSFFQINAKRVDAVKENNWDWKFCAYHLFKLNCDGDILFYGVVNRKIYAKLKTLKDLIDSVYEVSHDEVTIYIDGVCYTLTDVGMEQVEDDYKGGLRLWANKSTIDSILNVNKFIYEEGIHQLVKIPSAKYVFKETNNTNFADSALVYDPKYNESFTVDIDGDKVVKLLVDGSVATFISLKEKHFNDLVELQ